MQIRATEQIARETIDGLMDDILGYINPANDNMLSAWQMALERGKGIMDALDTVCKAIAARPSMNPGQVSLIPASDIASPELDAAFDELETLALETAEKREAARIDAAHPVVLSPLSDALRIVRPA